MKKRVGIATIRHFCSVLAIVWTSLILAAAANAATIVWDASPDSSVVGYVVHIGSASGVYGTEVNVGNATSFTLPAFPAGSTKYLAVTSYDASGSRSSYSNEIVFTQPGSVAAGFTASTTSGPAPLALNFTSSSTGTITSYVWTFGDGTGSSSQNPAKVYSTPGTYTVSLKVTGPDGSDTHTKTNYISVTTSNVTGGGKDTTPPSVPGIPNAVVVGGTSIKVSWPASTDNVGVAGYRVERCKGSSCGNFAQIGSATGTSYTDNGLSPSTTYRYRVRAFDAAGNLSGYSNFVGATTAKDSTAPSAPGTPVASLASNTTVSLRWPAATDNVGVVSYRLERCAGATCTNFANIASPTGTTYNDPGLARGTTYRYRLRAVDAAANIGPYSPIVSIATPTSTTIGFVQLNHSTPQGNYATVTVPFKSAQSAGNLNVVVVGWEDQKAVVSSVTDSMGNVYVKAVGPHIGMKTSQSIYYAKNIKGANAGANTVTVKFLAPAPYPDVRVVEYRGIDPVNPVDVVVGGTGTSYIAITPMVTTHYSNSLLFASTMVWSHVTGPGTGFTQRGITYNGNIVEDRIVSSPGSYNASAPLTPNDWVIQMVVFRGAQ